MIGSDLVRAGAFVALTFTTSATQIVILATVVGVATGFFRPAVYAGLPNLVRDEDLPTANSLLQAVDNLTWALGSLVGGALAAAVGVDAAYWINAATFLLSAALLFAIVKARGRPLALPGYRMAIVLGLLQVALFVALSHFALLEAGPGKTSVLVFTMPFWMIVFAHFGLMSKYSPSSTTRSITSYMLYGWRGDSGTMSRSASSMRSTGSVVGRIGGFSSQFGGKNER